MHIRGYVNVTEKKSRPVITPHGKVIEIIEPNAFSAAIKRAENIALTIDHEERTYANTKDKTLKLHEDEIGLYADVLITDKNLASVAKAGKIKGWSFGMYNISDEIEHRAENLPIRHIKDLDLDHITLVINKTPIYSATSLEVRAGVEKEIEERAANAKLSIITNDKSDNSNYHDRLYAIKRRIKI